MSMKEDKLDNILDIVEIIVIPVASLLVASIRSYKNNKK